MDVNLVRDCWEAVPKRARARPQNHEGSCAELTMLERRVCLEFNIYTHCRDSHSALRVPRSPTHLVETTL